LQACKGKHIFSLSTKSVDKNCAIPEENLKSTKREKLLKRLSNYAPIVERGFFISNAIPIFDSSKRIKGTDYQSAPAISFINIVIAENN
jgi:hypothetical protein